MSMDRQFFHFTQGDFYYFIRFRDSSITLMYNDNNEENLQITSSFIFLACPKKTKQKKRHLIRGIF
ncbi:hypothetical protein DHD05_15465 [Arenibacter sp. N53]|nr:hypothetical protein [Arenibacter sp. N53]